MRSLDWVFEFILLGGIGSIFLILAVQPSVKLAPANKIYHRAISFLLGGGFLFFGIAALLK